MKMQTNKNIENEAFIDKRKWFLSAPEIYFHLLKEDKINLQRNLFLSPG